MRTTAKMILKKWIRRHETFKLIPHTDADGKMTIGWGRRLIKGLSLDEANYLFDNDIKEIESELSNYSWYINQPENVQHALLHMAYALGINDLLSFKMMKHYLINKNYALASIEILNSSWADKNPERAKDVSLMMRQE
jgi:GH24 family phage-related lysozyme (muramidase)